MPTYQEMNEAQLGEKVLVIAQYTLGEELNPSNIFKAAKVLEENPSGWGLPKRWKGKPNWYANTIVGFACEDLFQLPYHPQAEVVRQYPYLPKKHLSKLYFGETPQSIAGVEIDEHFSVTDGVYKPSTYKPILTKKEAQQWLRDCSENRKLKGSHWKLWLDQPLVWLAKGIRTDGNNFHIRSRKVALWLKRQASWPCWWLGMAAGYGPDGRMVMAPVHDMVDEIFDSYLVSGEKTSPERVFRAIMEKMTDAAKERLMAASLPFPKSRMNDTRSVKQIRNSRDLVIAANKLHNCSAGYAQWCQVGKISIWLVNGGKSMFEFNEETLHMVQHRAANNYDPDTSEVREYVQWRKINGM